MKTRILPALAVLCLSACGGGSDSSGSGAESSTDSGTEARLAISDGSSDTGTGSSDSTDNDTAGSTSGPSSGSSSGTTSGTSSFSLSVTDGPVDTAQEVVLQFNGVEIKPAEGDSISFEFDPPVSLDMLTLQGSASEQLLQGESIPAGDYEWIRMDVSARHDSIEDSYIVLEDGTRHEIRIPGSDNTGLKLVSGFIAPDDASVDFTVDFDLRKSIINPPGQPGVIMKPVLRLIDNHAAGTISGIIDNSLVAEACENASENDGAVYVYNGEIETATDISGADSDPVTTALVDEEGGTYSYEAGFLEEGDYSVAYTCDNELDEAESEEALTFHGLARVSVAAGGNATHDFAPGSGDDEEATGQEDSQEGAESPESDAPDSGDDADDDTATDDSSDQGGPPGDLPPQAGQS